MTRQWMTALAAAGLVVLGGCGGGDDGAQVATAGGGGPTSSAAAEQPVVDEEDRARRFAQCMREHGVDVPDPDPNGKIRIGGPDGTVDKETMRPALEACREFMPNGGERRELSPEDLERLRQMAQCMREHGVDMPDPDPNGQGGLTVPKNGDGKNPRLDEDFQKAVEACRHLAPVKEGDG